MAFHAIDRDRLSDAAVGTGMATGSALGALRRTRVVLWRLAPERLCWRTFWSARNVAAKAL